jgi:hypothetical protein
LDALPRVEDDHNQGLELVIAALLVRFRVPRLCALVPAHELGHLLLGSNAHSCEGIMRPSWHGNELRAASMGALLFTPEQARSIREGLSRDP